MIQHLVHKCRYCKGIAKLTLVDGVITHLEGAKPYSIGWGSTRVHSTKLLICTNPYLIKLSGTYACGREMKVSSFKPITL